MNTEKKNEGPFAVQGDFVKQLSKMSSHLRRGNGSPETLINDAPDIVNGAMKMATYQLATLDKMIESYEVGDKETLGNFMMSMIDNIKGMKELELDSSELELPEGLTLDDMIPEEYDLDSIAPSALAEIFDPEMYYVMANYLRERLIPIFDDTGLTLHNIKHHHHHRRRLDEKDLDASDFDFGRDNAYDSSSNVASGHNSFNKSNLHSRRATTFKTKSHLFSTPNFSFDGKPPKGIKLPKIDMIKQLKAKKGIFHGRRLSEPAPQCVPCDEKDYVCNCRRLQDCAKNLTLYDLSASLLGGFVSIVLS